MNDTKFYRKLKDTMKYKPIIQREQEKKYYNLMTEDSTLEKVDLNI